MDYFKTTGGYVAPQSSSVNVHAGAESKWEVRRSPNRTGWVWLTFEAGVTQHLTVFLTERQVAQLVTAVAAYQLEEIEFALALAVQGQEQTVREQRSDDLEQTPTPKDDL